MARTEWLPGVQLRHLIPHVQYTWKILEACGCPVVIAQWQNIGRALAAQVRHPGFDSRQLPAT